MSQNEGGAHAPVISGKALQAAVRAAETPVVGQVVKDVFMRQLGIDRLLEMDLREARGAPEANVIAPVYPDSPMQKGEGDDE